jgi:hypothetical protein
MLMMRLIRVNGENWAIKMLMDLKKRSLTLYQTYKKP